MSDVTLPNKAKPSKALSSDPTQPHLQQAYIQKRDEVYIIIATDSYRLAELTVEVDGDVPEGPLSKQALKTVEKTGRFEVGEEYVEPLSAAGAKNGVLFRRPTEGKPPDTAKLWPKDPEPKHRFEVGLNAEFIAELAAAIGAGDKGRHRGIKLVFDLSKAKKGTGDSGKTYQSPVVIESLHPASNGRGLLMPIRVNV